jgi:hypothetical protein
MSSKNKKVRAIIPYRIDMGFDLAGLEGIPEDTQAPQIFCNWVVKSIISYSEQSKGLLIQHHRQAKRIREIFDEVIKTYGQNRKQKVLSDLRVELKLEGLQLFEVEEFIKLASKAPKNEMFTNASDLVQVIAKAQIESAVAVADLEPDDWKFMKQCWDESRHPMQANEVIIRIDGKIRESMADHDRKVQAETNGEDEAEETPSPAVEIMPPTPPNP